MVGQDEVFYIYEGRIYRAVITVAILRLGKEPEYEVLFGKDEPFSIMEHELFATPEVARKSIPVENCE